jgi:hypothetical protein
MSRSPALVRQIEQLQSKEAVAEELDYILFTHGKNDPDIGIVHPTPQADQAKAQFKEVRTCAFTNRHATAEVRHLYEMLKSRLTASISSGVFTDADLRSQLKAEYGFDPLEG